MAILVTA